MDKTGTLLGFLFGSIFILLGILWPSNWSNLALILEENESLAELGALINLMRFVDVKSFFIVFGGTLSTVFIAFPIKRTLRSFKSIPKVFSSDTIDTEAQNIFEQSKKVAEKRFQGKRISSDDLNSITNPIMRRWIEALIVREQVSEETLEEVIESEIRMYDRQAEEEHEVIEFMSMTAPAFGMMGAVIGLVLMLAETGSIRSVMQAMSVAMITTLYGVILANLVFQPLASKRKQLKDSHLVIMEMISTCVKSIAKRESPYTLLQELALYLPEKRLDFDHQYR